MHIWLCPCLKKSSFFIFIVFCNWACHTQKYESISQWTRNYIMLSFNFRKNYKWDVFRLASDDNISGSELACWNACFTVNRVVLCILIFVFVFTTSVISKFTFILMTTNIFPNKGGLKNPNQTLKYFKEKKEFTNVEVTWIWSLLLAVIAPYVFTVLKYLWVLLFKKTRKLNFTVLLAVSCLL